MGNITGRMNGSSASVGTRVEPSAVVPPTAFPFLFAPQVPIAPLQTDNDPPMFRQAWQDESDGVGQVPQEGIPTIITWNHDGDDVAVEGSWDNWTSRRQLQGSYRDFAVLMVLPLGIYHYKFIVDGQSRYVSDLPFATDELGNICNILCVQDYVPDNLDSVADFDPSPSPDSSYDRPCLTKEDFEKDPPLVPIQLPLAILDMENIMEQKNSSPSSKPQHVFLEHLFIENGQDSNSTVAFGMTGRFKAKYVTFVLYTGLRK